MSLWILVKAPLVVLILALFAGSAAVGSALLWNPTRRRRFLIWNMSKFAWLFLKATRTQVEDILKSTRATQEKGRLIVSNHVSWLDAVILSARTPSVFVTSVEVRDTPILGQICRLSGCVFIERRNKEKLDQEISNLATVLQDGFDVVLFPEGTSTDGAQVLPFRKSFFRSAVVAGCDVVPVALVYSRADNEPVSASNRDALFYYGDLQFGPQFLSFLGLESSRVEVRGLNALDSKANDHRSLAELARSRIVEVYVPISDKKRESQFAGMGVVAY